MCVVITCEDGARPSEDTLEQAARKNRDGAGVAWIEEREEGRKVVWEKGLDVEGVKRLSSEVPHPYVVHFRRQSAGASTDDLTHPFPIDEVANNDLSGTADRVLFHNGTVSDWEDRYQTFIASRPVNNIPEYGMEAMSDTRAMAYMVAQHTQIFDDQEEARLQAERLLQVFGEDDRFAILDAQEQSIRRLGDWWYCTTLSNPEEAHRLYEEDGTYYEGGLLFSNKSWNKRTSYGT